MIDCNGNSIGIGCVGASCRLQHSIDSASPVAVASFDPFRQRLTFAFSVIMLMLPPQLTKIANTLQSTLPDHQIAAAIGRLVRHRGLFGGCYVTNILTLFSASSRDER